MIRALLIILTLTAKLGLAQTSNRLATVSNVPPLPPPVILPELAPNVSQILRQTNPPPPDYYDRTFMQNAEFIFGKFRPQSQSQSVHANTLTFGYYGGREGNILGILNGDIFLSHPCLISIKSVSKADNDKFYPLISYYDIRAKSQRMGRREQVALEIQLKQSDFNQQVSKGELFYDIPTPPEILQSLKLLSEEKMSYYQFAEKHLEYLKSGNKSLKIIISPSGRPLAFSIYRRQHNNQAEMKSQMETLFKKIQQGKFKISYTSDRRNALLTAIELYRQGKINHQDFLKQFPEYTNQIQIYDYQTLLHCVLR